MKAVMSAVVVLAVGSLFLAGCAVGPEAGKPAAELTSMTQQVIEQAQKEDPGIKAFFDRAAGYAVFPVVGKGAIGLGGAYGRGELFEGKQRVGYCDLMQASIGLALGGQTYSEIIFFETKSTLDDFKSGNFTFAAQASAVALKSGAAANAKYADGVAAFSMVDAGLMFEASVGGQKFRYVPK